MSHRVTKTPEQLQSGNVIPIWDGNLTIESVQFDAGVVAVVTFTNGMKIGYSPGSVVEIIVEDSDPEEDPESE